MACKCWSMSHTSSNPGNTNAVNKKMVDPGWNSSRESDLFVFYQDWYLLRCFAKAKSYLRIVLQNLLGSSYFKSAWMTCVNMSKGVANAYVVERHSGTTPDLKFTVSTSQWEVSFLLEARKLNCTSLRHHGRALPVHSKKNLTRSWPSRVYKK